MKELYPATAATEAEPIIESRNIVVQNAIDI
jgi:hypothetical protein